MLNVKGTLNAPIPTSAPQTIGLQNPNHSGNKGRPDKSAPFVGAHFHVSQHIRLFPQNFFVILHLDFHAVGALLRGVYRYGTREIYYIFEKAYIYALFLATRNFEHSKQSLKDRVTIGATGMYIPIRAHFRHLLEMGLGYLHITAWSRSCSFWRLKQVRRLRVAGRVMIRLPLFFLPKPI